MPPASFSTQIGKRSQKKTDLEAKLASGKIMNIYYNAQETGQINVPIGELEINSGSPIGRMVETTGLEPATSCV